MQGPVLITNTFVYILLLWSLQLSIPQVYYSDLDEPSLFSFVQVQQWVMQIQWFAIKEWFIQGMFCRTQSRIRNAVTRTRVSVSSCNDGFWVKYRFIARNAKAFEMKEHFISGLVAIGRTTVIWVGFHSDAQLNVEMHSWDRNSSSASSIWENTERRCTFYTVEIL